MKKLCLGVIGAGRIGKLHVENIKKHLPFMHIKQVADPFLDAAWLKTTPVASGTLDANDVLQDPEIEAVLICSPAPLHVPQIIAAARTGKHIFCEKPIATDIAAIKTALAEVKKAGVKLQVGFNRRYDPNFAKVKHVISTNSIGKPHLLRITSRDPEIPPADYLKTSSGMFLDMTIHDFDMARFLMNSEIDEVYATGAVLIHPVFHESNDIDTAIINLKFANGCLGVIDNSRQAMYGYDQRVEVFGSEGAIHADNNKPTNTTLSTHQGITTEKPLRFFLERYKESYVNELQDFYNSIVNDTPPPVTGKDGLLSVLIGIAAQQSLRENKPVKINHAAWSDCA